MKQRSHKTIVNGLEHHVVEVGEGAATAIVVHGFHDNGATWDDVAEGLARAGLRVLVPDMRGFGDGPRVPPGAYYYFPDYVSDLAGIVRAHVADGPLFVIGHSMGATIVSYFAGAFPERLTKLALVDGVGPPDNAPDLGPVRMHRWIETAYEAPVDRKPMTREDALARLCRFNPDIDEAILARKLPLLSREVGPHARAEGEASSTQEGGLVWKTDPLHSTTSPLAFFAETYKAFARRVTCPVLYVSGGVKGYHVADEDERLACFAKIERVTIEGGHSLHWSNPARLTEELLSFWRR